MCLYNRPLTPAAETPEQIKTRIYDQPAQFGIINKYKIITPTISYYVEADTVIYSGNHIIFKLNSSEVACISLNTVYGFYIIDSRPASSEVQP